MTPRRAGHIAVRPEWLALHREEALDPDLPIIDAHHHIYDRPDNRYLPPQLIEDLSSGHQIEATVFIECRAHYDVALDEPMQPVGEVEYVRGIADAATGTTRICEAIVGYADLDAGSRIAKVLETEIEAGGGRFKGVRNISAWHKDPEARGSTANPPPDLLTTPRFFEGLKVLTSMGLSFDAFMYHTQLPELTALARKFPDTPIIMNHCGGFIGIGPYAAKRTETFAEWKGFMRDLALCPNVRIKLGGLGMRLFGFDVHAGDLPPSSEQLAKAWGPMLEACIELFGPKRAMFESNFPVDKGSCSYAALWNAFKIVSKGYSADERDWMFRRTAAEAYRLRME